MVRVITIEADITYDLFTSMYVKKNNYEIDDSFVLYMLNRDSVGDVDDLLEILTSIYDAYPLFQYDIETRMEIKDEVYEKKLQVVMATAVIKVIVKEKI